MRSLRLILMLVFSMILTVQAGESVSEARDTLEIAVSALDSLVDTYLQNYASDGLLDARIEVAENPEPTGKIRIILVPGAPAMISHIHFTGAEKKDVRYLQKEFLLVKDSIPFSDLERAEARIIEQGYVYEGKRLISRDRQNDLHLSYHIIKSPTIKIDALAAFNQQAGNDTLIFFGHINLYAPNIDGNGKSIGLNWKRPKANSERFFLSYSHPWLLGTPLNGTAGFGREVVEGNYQIITANLGLSWTLDWGRSLELSYVNHQSVITFEGEQLNPEWRSVRRRSVGIGYRQIGLDRKLHRGLSLKTVLYQELNFEAESVSRLSFRSEAEYPIFSSMHISQRSALTIQSRTETIDDPSIRYPLGGVSSVRGYEEDYLRSVSVASFQHELNYRIGDQSQLMILLDLGYYLKENKVNQLLGYGIGVQLRSGRGPLRIILASHRGLSLRNSFMHIEYSAGIPWIER